MAHAAHELVATLQSLSQQIPGMDVDLILANRLIRQLATRTTACFNDCLKQHGLTESLWYALLAVYVRRNHEILPSELSEMLGGAPRACQRPTQNHASAYRSRPGQNP